MRLDYDAKIKSLIEMAALSFIKKKQLNFM